MWFVFVCVFFSRMAIASPWLIPNPPKATINNVCISNRISEEFSAQEIQSIGEYSKKGIMPDIYKQRIQKAISPCLSVK